MGVSERIRRFLTTMTEKKSMRYNTAQTVDDKKKAQAEPEGHFKFKSGDFIANKYEIRQLLGEGKWDWMGNFDDVVWFFYWA